MFMKPHPKYGLNPTMPTCFFCGEDKGIIALLGAACKDANGKACEAPMHMLLDYEPCDKCKEKFKDNVLLIEASQNPICKNQQPIQKNLYPTGRWCLIKKEAAKKMFTGVEVKDKALVDVEVMNMILSNRCEE